MHLTLYIMAKSELLIFFALAALVCCTEVEDVEQKKRGAGKGTSINAIPTGAQKQDYTYSIYAQNPSSQTTSSSPSYQSQVPNSFYPSQGGSQYYATANTQSDSSSSYTPQQQQPQINLLPPPTSQFVPLNFVPNPGYQSKYQLVPPKSNGNIQLAFLQPPPSYPTQSIVPYAPQLFSPNPSGQVNPHQNPLLNSLPQGHFNVPNYQQLSLGGSYLGQPSMFLFAQPNPSPYNNLLYQNPVQSFYNYYPSNAQSKYNVQYVPQGTTAEYEKLQGPVTQNISKEDNDITHSSEYTAPADSNSSYKNAYAASRSTYSKL